MNADIMGQEESPTKLKSRHLEHSQRDMQPVLGWRTFRPRSSHRGKLVNTEQPTYVDSELPAGAIHVAEGEGERGPVQFRVFRPRFVCFVRRKRNLTSLRKLFVSIMISSW